MLEILIESFKYYRVNHFLPGGIEKMPILLESLDRKDYGRRNTKGPKASQGEGGEERW